VVSDQRKNDTPLRYKEKHRLFSFIFRGKRGQYPLRRRGGKEGEEGQGLTIPPANEAKTLRKPGGKATSPPAIEGGEGKIEEAYCLYAAEN